LSANPVRDTSRPGQASAGDPGPADIEMADDTAGSDHGSPDWTAPGSQMDLDPGRPPQTVPATTPPSQLTPHQTTPSPKDPHPATPDQVTRDQATTDHGTTDQTPVSPDPVSPTRGSPSPTVPERSAGDRSWEFSAAHTAGWSRPQVKIGEHDWRPV